VYGQDSNIARMKKMKIVIKDTFSKDYITREAGEKLRNMIIQSNEVLTIDFSNTKIASTSFFDEAFAKLSDEKIQKKWKDFICIININELDKKLLIQITKNRNVDLF